MVGAFATEIFQGDIRAQNVHLFPSPNISSPLYWFKRTVRCVSSRLRRARAPCGHQSAAPPGRPGTRRRRLSCPMDHASRPGGHSRSAVTRRIDSSICGKRSLLKSKNPTPLTVIRSTANSVRSSTNCIAIRSCACVQGSSLNSRIVRPVEVQRHRLGEGDCRQSGSGLPARGGQPVRASSTREPLSSLQGGRTPTRRRCDRCAHGCRSCSVPAC